MADRIKPIPSCRFCCVAVEERGASFNKIHPHCKACGILMGAGHVEDDASADYCSTCARTKQQGMLALS